MIRTTCPTPDTLNRLLAGGPTDPPPADLYAHIGQCKACVRTLFDLDKGDTLPNLGGPDRDAHDTRASVPLVRRVPHTPPTASDHPPGVPIPADVLAVLDPPQSDGEIGRLGAYRVLALLGHGGMGAVFQAEDPRLGRRVALKVMLPHVARQADMAERFLREARSAAALEHDHVVPVYEVGEAGGVPYIAMQYLKGETLDDHMTRHPGPRPAAEVVRVGRQVAAGLAAAHAVGLVHRDIKPANLWLDSAADGRVKILDFGLARGDCDERLTAAGAVLGTPAFMAPEQARGEPSDGRSDLFSLGVVLYRLAAGVLPFTGKGTLGVLASLATETPVPVRERNAHLPPPLARLIDRLIAKSPHSRPASAEAVLAELSSIPIDPPTAAATRRPRWRVAVAVAAAVVLAGIVFAVFKLTFETKDGTLIVEVDADADVRFRNGAVQVYDEKGELKYTLTPSAKNKPLPAGKYRVTVVGADGLSLDTDQFEMGKGGKTVRVRAEPPKPAPADLPKGSAPLDVRSETAFPGKLVFRDTFESADNCRLPLADGPTRREVKEGRYVVTREAVKAGEAALIEVGSGTAVGAFAGKVRVDGGDLYLNFRVRNDGRTARWLAVEVSQAGGWAVMSRRHEREGEKWVSKPDKPLASSTADDVGLVAGKWVTLAARWSDTEYEVWLNGKRVTGGKVEGGDVPDGKPTPVQLVLQSPRGGGLKLETDLLSVWDANGK